MIERLKVDALISAIQDVVLAPDPITALDAFTLALRNTLPERTSKKHMVGLNLGIQGPAPSLKYRLTA
ncbi:MAG: hypothetical protein V4563_13825 [Pseudomonadota bacterium]